MLKKAYGIDLHMHTLNSDGTQSVEEIICDAKEFGLKHIALTDHNQFAITVPQIYEDIEVIPGAEFSVSYHTESGKLLEVHIVGLFFDGVPKGIHHIFKKIPVQRKQYLDAVITKLNYLGISISYEELYSEFQESNQLGRRHIAEILIKKGYADSVSDAFDRFIGNRSPYWVDAMKYMRYISMEKCVKLICENKGFPILAHPYHYHCPDEVVLKLVKDFKDVTNGYPAGIEVYYSKYDEERRKRLKEIAAKYSLLPSAASDHHTPKDGFVRGSENLLLDMKQAWTSRNK